MADNEAAAKADNEKRRQVREETRKKDEEDIKKIREDQVKLSNEKITKDAKLRPTPTPEEIALAYRGHNVDQKEPDGSPEQNVFHTVVPHAAQIEVGRKVTEAKPHQEQQGYSTRAAAPKKE